VRTGPVFLDSGILIAFLDRSILRKLERLSGHRLTYVDAGSLVLLERLQIRDVWGTDRDLGLEGARVVPVHGGR
jgi:hypothetical protein